MNPPKTLEPSAARLWLDGEAVEVAAGSSLAAFLLQKRPPGWSRSVEGSVRAPLCGMGICAECRVWVDGGERLACMTPCQDGMTIQTDFGPRPGEDP